MEDMQYLSEEELYFLEEAEEYATRAENFAQNFSLNTEMLLEDAVTDRIKNILAKRKTLDPESPEYAELSRKLKNLKERAVETQQTASGQKTERSSSYNEQLNAAKGKREQNNAKRKGERINAANKAVEGMNNKIADIKKRVPTFSTKAKNFAKIQLERIKKAKTYLVGKAKVHFGSKENKEANILALRKDLKAHNRVIKGLKDPNRAEIAKIRLERRKVVRQ
jgi:uncharacterized protein YoxC